MDFYAKIGQGDQDSMTGFTGGLPSKGQIVKVGEVVGITGNTGRSTGEHLHITIRQKGKYINPKIFIDYIHFVQESCMMALAHML